MTLVGHGRPGLEHRAIFQALVKSHLVIVDSSYRLDEEVGLQGHQHMEIYGVCFALLNINYIYYIISYILYNIYCILYMIYYIRYIYIYYIHIIYFIYYIFL